MEHKYIDEYAERSPYSKVDPRTKLVILIAFLVIAALAISPRATISIGIISVVIAAGSMIPPRHLIYGLTPAIPFIVAIFLSILLVGTIENAIIITIRILASALAAITVASTTPMFDQLRALQWFKVPAVITLMILFVYRFIFVFIDELERMKISRIARGLDLRKGSLFKRRLMHTLGQTIGMLFVRVNNRASRVFDSLRARGFSGEIKGRRILKFRAVDALYALTIAALMFIPTSIQLGLML